MNEKTQILFNPFRYIAGYAGFLLGIGIIFLLSFVSWITGTHQFGVLRFRLASDTTFLYFLFDHFIHWILVSTFLYLAGLIFSSSKIRWIDIAGTSAISRAPLVLFPLIRLIPYFQSFITRYSIHFLLLTSIHIIIVIWSIALLYNAFRISCNLVRQKSAMAFIICILLAEIITQLFIFLVYKY